MYVQEKLLVHPEPVKKKRRRVINNNTIHGQSAPFAMSVVKEKVHHSPQVLGPLTEALALIRKVQSKRSISCWSQINVSPIVKKQIKYLILDKVITLRVRLG